MRARLASRPGARRLRRDHRCHAGNRWLRLFPESIEVGAQFGVILIPRDGLKVEVATFRSDVGYRDGRHPDASFTRRTPQEDVQRRDFTINGLLMRHDTGEVLDFVDGQADLKRKVIRAIASPTAVSRKTNSA